MERAKAVLHRLLYPGAAVFLTVVPASFAALIFLFVKGVDSGVLAITVYVLSAYALTVCVAGCIRYIKPLCARIRRTADSVPPVARFLHDRAFRGEVGIWQGMTANLAYMLFRLATGLYYRSVWFLSMAAYYAVLGLLRAYLARRYRHRAEDPHAEIRAYRRTAWMLLVLNIPMGGMILLTVRADAGFSYPGYIIYVSALYTFYIAILAAVNLVKYRKLGSPVLSAAKTLNLVSALMSLLGLQTAMIDQFSPGDTGYRKLMNSLTGSAVWIAVILIAVCMQVRAAKFAKEAPAHAGKTTENPRRK